MKLRFVGKNITVTDALREITQKKLSKLDKYFRDELEGTVVYSTVRNEDIVEVTLNLPNTIIRAEESTTDMYNSIDRVVAALDRQILKNKTKLQKRYKNNDTIRFDNFAPVVEEEPAKIVKRKKFALKPMSEDEAVMQMELLNHNFFVFRDEDTNEIKVAYVRNDGHYGIIEDEIK